MEKWLQIVEVSTCSPRVVNPVIHVYSPTLVEGVNLIILVVLTMINKRKLKNFSKLTIVGRRKDFMRHRAVALE